MNQPWHVQLVAATQEWRLSTGIVLENVVCASEARHIAPPRHFRGRRGQWPTTMKCAITRAHTHPRGRAPASLPSSLPSSSLTRRKDQKRRRFLLRSIIFFYPLLAHAVFVEETWPSSFKSNPMFDCGRRRGFHRHARGATISTGSPFECAGNSFLVYILYILQFVRVVGVYRPSRQYEYPAPPSVPPRLSPLSWLSVPLGPFGRRCTQYLFLIDAGQSMLSAFVDSYDASIHAQIDAVVDAAPCMLLPVRDRVVCVQLCEAGAIDFTDSGVVPMFKGDIGLLMAIKVANREARFFGGREWHRNTGNMKSRTHVPLPNETGFRPNDPAWMAQGRFLLWLSR